MAAAHHQKTLFPARSHDITPVIATGQL